MDIDEAREINRRALLEHVFQPGDAPNQPENKRQQAAVARWIEIDTRQFNAMYSMKPDETFRLTAAERQLKHRLLKAGLIIIKDRKGRRWSKRKRRAMELETQVHIAKRYAANGDPNAIRYLENLNQQRTQERWQKKQRALRRVSLQNLVEATKDVMARDGKRRTLPSLWRDFALAWEEAPVEKRQAFLRAVPDAGYLAMGIVEVWRGI